MEKTFSMIKPDGIQRGLVGEILQRFEKKGIKIAAMKFMMISRELAEKHYTAHKGKGFYDDLIRFITSSPVLALDVEYNLIHASDSKESAEREISLFFREEEIINYELITAKWVYPK